MILKIHHQLHPTFNEMALGILRHVATLKTNQPLDHALDDAFRLTNHMRLPWYETAPAELTPEPGRHRSTSVGDIVTVDDREAYQCRSVGWRKTDIGIVRVMVLP